LVGEHRALGAVTLDALMAGKSKIFLEKIMGKSWENHGKIHQWRFEWENQL